MIYGVKCSGEVEEEKDGYGTRVSGKEEIIGDFKEGSFCAMVRTES